MKYIFSIAISITLFCQNVIGAVVTDTSGIRYFKKISVEDGLSQSTVFAISQDTLGFMWFGTQDGLNRYDGKSFVTYRPVKGDPYSLQSNYIRSVFLDRDGMLWVGGNNGISKYDYALNKFKNYSLPRTTGEWFVTSITEDKQHTLWTSTSSGQIFFLKHGTSVFRELTFSRKSLGIKNVRVLLCVGDDLFMGTDAGLYNLQIAGKKIKSVNLRSGALRINTLFHEGRYLWVGTEGNGLLQYNVENNSMLWRRHKAGDERTLSGNDVRSINHDKFGNLWVGTYGGLSILNTKGGDFRNYYYSPVEPYTIAQNSIRCIYEDKNEGIWLGTFYGGVSYYHPGDLKFNRLSQNSGPLSLNDQVVNVIKQDATGNFWIGTNDKGLNYWDRQSRRMLHFFHDELRESGVSSNNIKAIEFDARGRLLIGTHNAGLNFFDPVTGNNKVFRHDASITTSIADNQVYALLRDHNNSYWIGTWKGLDLFDPLTETFTHVRVDKNGKRLTSDVIQCLMQDRRKRIWIGTNKGINIFYPDKGIFESFTNTGNKGALSEDGINCIVEDDFGRVWIGTKNGLNLFNENDKTFTAFSTSDGFPNNVIHGVLADSDRTLWISTNKGLVNFDPVKKKAQVFDSRDGIQSNQFSAGAFCKAADGMMLFGGIGGVTYFYPVLMKPHALGLRVAFTDLEVFNHSVVPGDNSKVLTAHIDQVGQVVFGPEQKQFTIYFNSFNYIHTNKITYQYMLEGYDEDWQETEDMPKASYSKLKPGRYEFLVRAIGPRGERSPVRSLHIKVQPPWWNSGWFYTLILIAVAIGGYIVYKVIKERIRTLQQLKAERMQREQNEFINKMKMEFFTNISHEFRTPLTLILAPIEEILKKSTDDKSLKKQHQLILLNARRLVFLLNQLMDFRKVELSTLKINKEAADLVAFVHEIYVSFTPLSSSSDIQYSFAAAEERLQMFFDKDCVEKICLNLLSNAFKFTNSGGKVDISVYRSEDGYAVIKVTDSGVGIEEKEQLRIFDQYYQVSGEKSRIGSGVGLALTKRLVELHQGYIKVESELGSGTSFFVMLPLPEIASGQEAATDKPELPLTSSRVLSGGETHEIEQLFSDGNEKEKMLVVDDNAEILDYLKEYFLKTYDVITAENGLKALKVIEDLQVDMIVCDIMMPEIDGIHFCKKVKQNIKTCHIPVILLTAKSELDQQLEGLEVGADDYITKPFSINLLDIKISNILRSRKRLKEYYSNSKEVVPENIALNALDEEFLREALRIVEENIAEPEFSIQEFCKKIGMSRSNLYMKFKAVTGESTIDFIKRIRFKKAIELIETRQHAIAEIAYLCGFSSASYFSTSFKQYFGYLPTDHLTRKAE